MGLGESIQKDIERVKGLEIGVNFFNGNPFVYQVCEENEQINREQPAKGAMFPTFDPMAHLTLNGNFCKAQSEVFDTAKELIEKAKDLPKFRTIGVNGEMFCNAGATIVQELAFVLAMGNQYLNLLTEKTECGSKQGLI